MTALQDLKEQQRQWAISNGLEPDGKGYVKDLESNLLQPMSERTRQAFENGSGSELLDGKNRPAKMRALHSSSALAVNFFDYWVEKDKTPLQEALGLDKEIISITFEEQFPTGLDGNPPNVDVTLKLSDGHVIGIESKFSEWLTPKTKSNIPFQPKYFPEGQKLWENVKLPKCQALAEAISDREVEFRYLYAPQLLKHALGMGNQLIDNFSLYYVYYDWPCNEGKVHKTEMALFKEKVDEQLRFTAISYQQLSQRLGAYGEYEEYIRYLRSRYIGS